MSCLISSSPPGATRFRISSHHGRRRQIDCQHGTKFDRSDSGICYTVTPSTLPPRDLCRSDLVGGNSPAPYSIPIGVQLAGPAVDAMSKPGRAGRPARRRAVPLPLNQMCCRQRKALSDRMWRRSAPSRTSRAPSRIPSTIRPPDFAGSAASQFRTPRCWRRHGFLRIASASAVNAMLPTSIRYHHSLVFAGLPFKGRSATMSGNGLFRQLRCARLPADGAELLRSEVFGPG